MKLTRLLISLNSFLTFAFQRLACEPRSTGQNFDLAHPLIREVRSSMLAQKYWTIFTTLSFQLVVVMNSFPFCIFHGWPMHTSSSPHRSYCMFLRVAQALDF